MRALVKGLTSCSSFYCPGPLGSHLGAPRPIPGSYLYQLMHKSKKSKFHQKSWHFLKGLTEIRTIENE